MNNGDKILEEIKVIRADMIEIKMAVMGSDKLKVNGLIQKVEKHSKYIETDKKFKYAIYGIAIVIGGVVGKFWNKLIG